uniref:SANT domain-containing protein n=1 Tax=Panagrolaimus sp. ES5 TaxID=591445 RepID=A0AC34FCS0_9BILA
MAAKEVYFKDKQKCFVDSLSDDQYNNLNLNNQYHQSAFDESLQRKIITNDSRKFQNNVKEHSKSWNKSSEKLPSNLLNNCRDLEEDEFKKAKNTNSSTLSLHIAAYENLIEVKNDTLNVVENEVLHRKDLLKKWETLNHFVDGSSSIIQNPFEFPRQQDDKISRPEMMQYTASQNLLNPNQMDQNIQNTSSPKMSKNATEKQRDETGDYAVGDDEDDGIDNEDTIAEDELHELDEDNDLEALQAEAEMDIEELRKRYYGGILGANEGENAGSSDTARDDEEEEEETSEEGEEISSELVQFMNTDNGDIQGYGSDDDDDEYAPKIYKPPRVGSAYQHLNIPAVDSTYKPVHDHADVLWKPTPKLNDQQLDQYQESVIEYSQDMDASKIPALQNDPVQPRMDRPIPFWDSEEALYTLMQNDYDPIKAKKAFAEGPPDVNLPRKTHFGICLPWEEADLLKFETGLHVYLKKFNKIQQEYLPGRSIGEVIHFYYRWKKTERFDLWRQEHQQAYVFAQDYQANSTDIMENIIELIERDDVPAAEANVLVAEAQSITAKIHGQPPP